MLGVSVGLVVDMTVAVAVVLAAALLPIFPDPEPISDKAANGPAK